jgi:hypothetical protein
MRRRLLAGFLIFALVLVVLVEVPFGLSLASNARTTALSEVQSDGASLALLVGSALGSGNKADARQVISRFAGNEHAIVVVASDGAVELSAGSGAAEEMTDAPTKAILASAEAGQASGEEGSDDPDDDFLYVALPVALKPVKPAPGPEPAATAGAHFGVVLLVATQAAPLHARIRRDWIELGLFGAVMLAVAAAVGTLLARSLTRRLAGIEAAVAAFGAGRLSERAPDGRGPAELRALDTPSTRWPTGSKSCCAPNAPSWRMRLTSYAHP